MNFIKKKVKHFDFASIKGFTLNWKCRESCVLNKKISDLLKSWFDQETESLIDPE